MTYYIRINNPWFLELDNNGLPAAGFLVYTFAAGSVPSDATKVDTYTDRSLTAKNSNPIILNSRGQADIYSNVALKMVYCAPGGDYTSPIWTRDYVGEQQGSPPLLAGVAASDGDNNYSASVSPLLSELFDQMVVVFTPDADSKDTIGGTTFTGTGIDDLTYSGPYVGSTPGAIFEVTIDGANFQGVGLSDVTWGGTPVLGHVYTVKISTAAGTDKFQWRKDGGAWSAEISMTGAAQTLTDGVTITFAATTGHTLTDLWNNVDTIKWRVDSGAYTSGVAITAALQTTPEGVGFTFAEKTGHILNDKWTMPVETPVRFNFCALGSKIIYKISGGSLVALGAGDLKAGFPANVIYSEGQDAYILLNPSLPVLTTIPRKIYRREIISDDTVVESDSGNELSYTGGAAHTLTLLPCTEAAGLVFDLFNATNYDWTIQTDPTAVSDLIITPESPSGVASMVLGPGQRKACRLVTNGVNYHLENDASYVKDFVKTTIFIIPAAVTAALSATAGVVTAGNHSVKVSFFNAAGSETIPSAVSGTVAADGTHAIDLTNVPVGPAGWTGRKYYMNQAGGGTWYYAGQDTNTGTTASINVADASLTVAAPTNGLWTKTIGYNWCEADVNGGGGGALSAGVAGGTNGGGAGGRSVKVIDITGVTSAVVTVGVAGTGEIAGGAAATVGGTSSFGSHCSGTGGGTNGDGGAATNGHINAAGAPGAMGTVNQGGHGGSGPYGGGGLGVVAQAAGNNASGYGAGGGGAFNAGVAANGGNGTPGIVIVKEWR